VPGTLHPLSIEYAPGETVATALADLMPRTTGNVLCFLPGAKEIAQTIGQCQAIASKHSAELFALHGSMDAAGQDAALARSSIRRRIIVATNIAETSLTVSGVSVVIDTGLQKVARYDEERGVDSLTTERITTDSADQRAGRAARLGPGIARRLWDARDRLRPHREAEVHRVDLAASLLSIMAWGAHPDSFEWFDRPSDDRIASAVSLLARLGAIDSRKVTALGQQLQRLPLHPRLARVLLEAHGSFEGCAACAWLSDPVPVERRVATASDVLPVLDRWAQMPPHLHQIARNLEQAARAILDSRYRPHIDEAGLRRALLAGYPDRVAKRRGTDRVTLATGHGAVIGRESGVHDADWIIALDVTSGRASATTQALVRMASRVEPEWLTPTHREVRHELDPESGTVRAHEVDWYDELALHEHPIAPIESVRTQMLASAWLEREPDERSHRLLQRLKFAGIDLELSPIVQLAAAQVRKLSDLTLTEEQLPWTVRQALASLAPERLTVPSGRDMTIEYGDDGTVSVAVKLQELFGLAETPRLGRSATPVTFHLLAPNGRPVQTTRDLKSFWERTYPEVRKELRGRYPRHPWPDDPWNATPTHRTKRGAARAAN
jgi:ATP-dependent helicase HrpB